MLKKILLALVVILGAFAGFVATRPAHMHVERSISTKAPPSFVYGQIADFHLWGTWSPWEKLDPTMKKTYSGPESGEGAHYAWVGNDKVGEGAMTIVGAKSPERVDIKLEFLKPFAATNATTFLIKNTSEGSTVTWAMDGENNFMAKAAGIFMDMDKMVGGDFERGLAQLKAASEGDAALRGDVAAPKTAARPADAKPSADDN
jgi:Polyketide cyclase / dehydrase and lipid transport